MLRKLAVLAVLAAALVGCGEKHDFTTVAETEGVYVDVDNLVYQVQMSRFLNPGDVEDEEYLRGLPEGMEPELPGDEIWFGVWMRVKNYSGSTQTPTDEFTVVDTEDNKFVPVPLDVETNVFAYDPLPLLQSQVLPTPDSAASSGPIQGSLILFRLKVESLQNRPLVLDIAGVAEVDLDL